jgi:hypothetical protein
LTLLDYIVSSKCELVRVSMVYKVISRRSIRHYTVGLYMWLHLNGNGRETLQVLVFLFLLSHAAHRATHGFATRMPSTPQSQSTNLSFYFGDYLNRHAMDTQKGFSVSFARLFKSWLYTLGKRLWICAFHIKNEYTSLQ